MRPVPLKGPICALVDSLSPFAVLVPQTQPPAITSANVATFTQGAAASFLVTTTGFPVAHLAEAGALPAGVGFVDNGNGTGTLGGTPSAPGTFVLTLSAGNGVGAGAVQTFTLTVLGGGPIATLSPGHVDFGSVSQCHFAVRIVTLQNTGSSALAIGRVYLTPGTTPDWDFFFVSLCRPTLAAGQSCPIYVVYFAEGLGTRTATLDIADNASGSPQQVSLTGVGVKGH